MAENMDIDTLLQEQPHLVAQIRREAITTERDRIKGIISSEEAEGRLALACELAFVTDVSAVEAQQLLAHAPTDKTSPVTPFEQAMADTPNPEIQPHADDETDDVEATAKRLASY